MLDDAEQLKQGRYWPSVSDLFMSLFIVTMVITVALYYVLLPKHSLGDDRAVVEAVGTDLQRIRDPVNAMRRKLGRKEIRSTQSAREVVDGLGITSDDVVQRLLEMETVITLLSADKAELEQHLSETKAALNDKPPIIRIDEATKEYRFDSGSALMSEAFRDSLRKNQFSTLASEILKRNGLGKYGVDTLEIIGHTDGQPVRPTGKPGQSVARFSCRKEREFRYFASRI
jgi:hypothetical protein